MILDRYVRELEWFHGPRVGEIERVPSGQSAFEAQMKAKSESQRHQPNRIISAGWSVSARGTDLGCGCTAHGGQGSDGGRVHRGMDDRSSEAVYEEAPILAALKVLPDLTQQVLRLRYGHPLTICAVCESGKKDASQDGKRSCLKAFGGFVGDDGVRGRAASAIGVRKSVLRGPGSVAHLTDVAQRAFGAARTIRHVADWIAVLGGRLCRGKAETAAERRLGNAIRDAAVDLCREAIEAYEDERQVSMDRVPQRVRRAARMACAA